MRSSLVLASLLVVACAPPPEIETTPIKVEPEHAPAPPEAPVAPKSELIAGIGGLHVGDSLEQVRALLGQEERTVLFEEERDSYTEAGYDLARQVPFVIGFDQVLFFSESEKLPLPVWKVYMKSGAVTLIKFTKAGFEERVKKTDFGVPPSCYLGRPAENVSASLGPAQLVEREKDYVEWHYLELGVSVIADSTGIIVLDVYGAIPEDLRLRLDEALRAPPSPPPEMP